MTFGKVNGAKIDRFFWGEEGGFLTLGKVFFFGEEGGGVLDIREGQLHRHGLGVGAKIDRFSGEGEEGGSDLKVARTTSVLVFVQFRACCRSFRLTQLAKGGHVDHSMDSGGADDEPSTLAVPRRRRVRDSTERNRSWTLLHPMRVLMGDVPLCGLFFPTLYAGGARYVRWPVLSTVATC